MHAEIAQSLMATKAEVEAKARYTVAISRPRDIDLFRQKILRACARRKFAETALYRRPVGGGKTVRGLSVRFAEQAMQYYGNLYSSTHTILDDEERRVVYCTVIDLETNSAVGADICVTKTVERKSPREGELVVSERVNSSGDRVYRIKADDEAITTKVAAIHSKLRRNLILQMLPADIKEEAMAVCEATLRADTDEDPDGAKRRLLDSFARLGVSATELKRYVGMPIEQLPKVEVDALRGIYQAISSGESTWAEYVADATANRERLALEP